MIGIETISGWIPSDGLSALEVGDALGVDRAFISEKLGTSALPRIGEGVATSDLAVAAARPLLDSGSLAAEDIRVLVVITQNPDGRGLPHTAAIVAEKLGLGPEVAAFDVSLGCSGFVYGLQIVRGLVEALGGRGLLITADPYSKIIDPADRDTVLLFGDGAAATVIGPEPRYRIGACRLGTDGKGAPHLCNRDGVLHMAGRQVFNFAATRVPREVAALMDAEGVSIEDIDLALLHQGSRYIVETLADRLRLPREKVPIETDRTGNTVSSSIPLLLETVLKTPGDAWPRRVLMAGFGVGFSWGVGLLERV
ncbi:MAG: hypothetical protein RLZZ461_27 [Planctomycetota bacterium]